MDEIEHFDQDAFLVRIGAQIGKVRRSKAYSQDRLALEAGLARGTLSKIERGLVEPKVTTIAKIALVLKVPFRRFFDVTI